MHGFISFLNSYISPQVPNHWSLVALWPGRRRSSCHRCQHVENHDRSQSYRLQSHHWLRFCIRCHALHRSEIADHGRLRQFDRQMFGNVSNESSWSNAGKNCTQASDAVRSFKCGKGQTSKIGRGGCRGRWTLHEIKVASGHSQLEKRGSIVVVEHFVLFKLYRQRNRMHRIHLQSVDGH